MGYHFTIPSRNSTLKSLIFSGESLLIPQGGLIFNDSVESLNLFIVRVSGVSVLTKFIIKAGVIKFVPTFKNENKNYCLWLMKEMLIYIYVKNFIIT
jgi:hypothetical protein